MPQFLSGYWPHIVVFFTGGAAVRTLNYVSKQLPPLPTNAGWWTRFAYALVSGTSGHDATYNAVNPANRGQ